MISSFDTTHEEREQWRARIQRALAELATAPPGLDGGPASQVAGAVMGDGAADDAGAI